MALFLMGWLDQDLLTHLSPSFSPVSYDIFRPDHSVLTLQLPVTASVREVMAALAHEDHWTKGQVLVKVNSAGGKLCLWINSPPWEGALSTPTPLIQTVIFWPCTCGKITTSPLAHHL